MLIEGTSFIAVLLSYKKLSSFTVLVVFKKLTTLQFRSIVTSSCKVVNGQHQTKDEDQRQ